MDIEIKFEDIQHGDYIVTSKDIVFKYIAKKVVKGCRPITTEEIEKKLHMAVEVTDRAILVFDDPSNIDIKGIYRRVKNVDIDDTDDNNKSDNVEHPSHYTSHPSGVECITVARHFCFDIGNAIKYLWRAGLKKEQGMSNLDKEIEDCNKAIWYIKDHVKMLNKKLNKNEQNDSVTNGHYKHDFM